MGGIVILFDPIFQDSAVALMAGEIASLALSRVTVPVDYYAVHSRWGATPHADSSTTPQEG